MSDLDQKTAATVADLTARRMRQLDESGDGPPRNSRGRYDARKFGRWLAKRMQTELGVASDGKCYDLSAERARHSKELADARSLANRVASGEFVATKELTEVLARMFLTFRTRALGVPSKLGPVLEGRPANEIAAELDREMREMLTTFATWRSDATKAAQ